MENKRTQPTIKDSLPPLTESQLAAAERRLGCRFPGPYRVFLLTHNGGTPVPNEFRVKGDDTTQCVEHLYGIAEHAPSWLDLFAAVEVFTGRMPPDMIPVAQRAGPGAICLSVAGSNVGKVYLLGGEGGVYAVADDFDGFLNSLDEFSHEFPPEFQLDLLRMRLEDATAHARNVLELLPGSDLAELARRILDQPAAGRRRWTAPPLPQGERVFPVRVTSPGAHVTLKQVARIEAAIGVRLPDAYRRFLLEHNGGATESNCFRPKEAGEEDSVFIRYFFEIGGGEYAGLAERIRAEAAVPEGTIPVGQGDEAGDLVCLSIRGPKRGAVYHVPGRVLRLGARGWAARATQLLADDFDELLRRGHDPNLDPWCQFQNALAWLDDGLRVAAELLQRVPGTAHAAVAQSLLNLLDTQGLAAAARAAEAMHGAGGEGPP